MVVASHGKCPTSYYTRVTVTHKLLHYDECAHYDSKKMKFAKLIESTETAQSVLTLLRS